MFLTHNTEMKTINRVEGCELDISCDRLPHLSLGDRDFPLKRPKMFTHIEFGPTDKKCHAPRKSQRLENGTWENTRRLIVRVGMPLSVTGA